MEIVNFEKWQGLTRYFILSGSPVQCILVWYAKVRLPSKKALPSAGHPVHLQKYLQPRFDHQSLIRLCEANIRYCPHYTIYRGLCLGQSHLFDSMTAFLFKRSITVQDCLVNLSLTLSTTERHLTNFPSYVGPIYCCASIAAR